VRKGSGPRVMAVLRSLNIDLCTVSGKASLAAANRHNMCNLEKPVEPVSIPNRERNDPNGRKTWSVIETALPRLFELRSFSLVGIALVPPKR
jgi:hypothetical protein